MIYVFTFENLSDKDHFFSVHYKCLSHCDGETLWKQEDRVQLVYGSFYFEHWTFNLFVRCIILLCKLIFYIGNFQVFN